MYVSLPTWNYVHLAQVDMSLQSKLPKLLSPPWCYRVLTTATLSWKRFPNSSLPSFKRFKIVLLGSFSKPLSALMITPLG